MLTTVFTGDEFEQRVRRRPTTQQPRARPIQRIFGDEAVKTLTVPSFAAAYNDLMGAVDIGDQLRASCSQDHRVCYGNWHAIAWSFLLETVLINSFLIQKMATNFTPFQSQRAWRQQLVDALIEQYSRYGTSRKRYRSGDKITPVAQHKRVRHKSSSPCLACKGITYRQVRTQSSQKRQIRPALAPTSGNQKVPQSRYRCLECNIALCNSDKCWYFYHSVPA